jgi:serine/threonine protein kinase
MQGYKLPQFLRYHDFMLKYPRQKPGSCSRYAEVYFTDDCAIKCQQTDSGMLPDIAINEIAMYGSFYHPCLMNIIEWTFDYSYRTLLFAMPKGIPICQAMDDGLITIHQIVSDTLSFISFLHLQGCHHGDIKPDNIVYHDGHAKIIDFGLSSWGYLATNGKYYTKQKYGTVMFMDPESVHGELVPIETDLWSLGKTWSFLLRASKRSHDQTEGFSCEIPEINELMVQMQKPVRTRITAYELLQLGISNVAVVRQHVGYRLLTSHTNEPPVGNRHLFDELMTWFDTTISKNDIIKIRFDALSILHRCLTKIVPDFYVNSVHMSAAQQLTIACYVLARIINGIIPDTSSIKTLGFPTTYITDYVVDIMHCLCLSICIPTYWDQASCAQDLPMLYSMAKSIDYITPSGLFKSNTSKYITFDQFKEIPFNILPVNEFSGEEYASIAVPQEDVKQIHSRWSAVVEAWIYHGENKISNDICVIFDLVAVLRYNYAMLPRLTSGFAQTIYAFLTVMDEVCGSSIDKLLPYHDWRNLRIEDFKESVNPWVTTPTRK